MVEKNHHMIVHAVIHGSPLCGFSNDFPKNWPEGNIWTDENDIKNINCPTCKEEAIRKIKTAPHGMYRVVAILPTNQEDIFVVKDFAKRAEAFIECTTHNVENYGRTYYCFDDQGKEPGAH